MKSTGKWASLCVGLLIFLGVLVANSFWTVKRPDIFRLLSDACITSAAVVGGSGGLIFASSMGTFDMLAYGFILIFDRFRYNTRKQQYRDFYEYKQAKGERQRPVAHMLIVGIVFFLFSWIFSFIWQKSF